MAPKQQFYLQGRTAMPAARKGFSERHGVGLLLALALTGAPGCQAHHVLRSADFLPDAGDYETVLTPAQTEHKPLRWRVWRCGNAAISVYEQRIADVFAEISLPPDAFEKLATAPSSSMNPARVLIARDGKLCSAPCMADDLLLQEPLVTGAEYGKSSTGSVEYFFRIAEAQEAMVKVEWVALYDGVRHSLLEVTYERGIGVAKARWGPDGSEHVSLTRRLPGATETVTSKCGPTAGQE